MRACTIAEGSYSSPVLGLILALVTASPSSGHDFPALRILYTSDLHGRAQPSPDFASTGLPRRRLGGWDNLLRLIQEQRSDATLLLDGGDFGFGSFAGDSSQARAGIEFMNLARYDATVIGPRDLTGGLANLEILAKAAGFPILADPMLDVALRRPVPLFRPYLVRNLKGVKVAVIGLTDPDVAQLNLLSAVSHWPMENPSVQLRRYLPAALAESADVIIVLAHLDLATGSALADSFPQVDLVICRGEPGNVGHRLARSHTVPVLGGAAYGQRLGVADLLFSRRERKVVQTEVKLLNVEPLTARDQPLAPAWLQQLSAPPRETTACLNPVEHLPDSAGKLSLAALLAEAVRRQAKADIAVIPGYVVESGLPSGRLGPSELFAVAPYHDRLRWLVLDDTALTQLVAAESVGQHEPAPLLAGADYFVTGDTFIWPEVSQVTRARVRNRRPGSYKVVTTEQWLERSLITVQAKLLPQTLTDLWLAYASGQESLRPVPRPRLYPATPGLVRPPGVGPVNVNTANAELLSTLPGIGPLTAQRIIEYRQTQGRFQSIDEIQNVKGIGPKKYERIRSLISVR